jgi:hypothetical protein
LALQLEGSPLRWAVATGAELVAILGFVAVVGATARNSGALFTIFRRAELRYLAGYRSRSTSPMSRLSVTCDSWLLGRKNQLLWQRLLVMTSFRSLGLSVAASFSFALLEIVADVG